MVEARGQRMQKRGKFKKDTKGRSGKRKFFKKKNCRFCQEKLDTLDYKDVYRLRKFISEKGKILPRRLTGNCAKHQRGVALAIKRARYVALLPYAGE